jgi:hypothetical protein
VVPVASAQTDLADMPLIHPIAAGYGVGDVADLLPVSPFHLQDSDEPLVLH